MFPRNTRTMFIGSITSTEASSRLMVSTEVPGESLMLSTRLARVVVGNSTLALRFTLERVMEGDRSMVEVDADASPEAILVWNSTINCSGLRVIVEKSLRTCLNIPRDQALGPTSIGIYISAIRLSNRNLLRTS